MNAVASKISPAMSSRSALAVTLVCAFVFTNAPASQERGGAERKTVWDGVYTAAQAQRGKAIYDEHCRGCHGPDFSGGEARVLHGDSFMTAWTEDHLASLFQKIRTTMPADKPSSLSDESYLAVIAAILEVNGFPAGRDELAPGSTLAAIRIEGKNGPAPVPNYAMVQVIGCLEQGPGNRWVLTNGGEPVRSRNPESSDAATLAAAAARQSTGSLTFQLLSVFPAPDAHRGHRVEVKGLLIRTGGGNQINVTSLAMVAPACQPQ